MDAEMQGRVAIVTGGGSGIGRATSLELARRGVHVAVADLSAEAASRVAGEVTALGAEALDCCVDVTAADQVQRTVRAVRERFGRIDILVNSAGIYQSGTIDRVSEADWDRVLAVNLKGTFLFCKAVIPCMLERRSGAIVNVSSISGRTKSQLAAVSYVASKAGVIGLTMCLANQLAGQGIRVNCVAPGSVSTPMTDLWTQEEREFIRRTIPMGRLGDPAEIASAIVYLASPAASFITGETLNINGGAFMV